MRTLVDIAENVLVSNARISEFGKLLDYSWNLKRGLTSAITTDYIDGIYKTARNHGAIGGKLMGAGGGGFMVLFAEPDAQPGIKSALSHLLHIPFKFAAEGSKVFYYTAEEYDALEMTNIT
jgi:D-glycero-alpha-D-manno-heptose-7-phosphate kinase